MKWYNVAEVLLSKQVENAPKEMVLAEGALSTLSQYLNLKEVLAVAWDDQPFPKEYEPLWRDRCFKVGLGCLYIKFKSGDKVYTYPLRLEIDNWEYDRRTDRLEEFLGRELTLEEIFQASQTTDAEWNRQERAEVEA